ncbi:hypothetical protein wTpre_1425 [Wolbachia endosymbiont of Trichogramma pretiosum]|nr:hypothetical protein wTpre_1425 [Wolbachia endosymbiont of Trichogramma pretiosum]
MCNNHLREKGCKSGSRNVIAGEVEKEVMKRAEQICEKWGK